jgi:hypothetical protein
MANKVEARYCIFRDELLEFLHIHYMKVMDVNTGRAVVRSLNFRNFEVRLEGSIVDFGKNSIKKILSTAGLTDKPRTAAGLALGLVWKEGDENLRENFADYAWGIIDGLREKGCSEEEIMGTVYDVVWLMKESGVNEEIAMEVLTSQFNLNGEGESIVQKVYWPEKERVG